MSLELPSEKRVKIKNSLLIFLAKEEFKIKSLAEIIGSLVAACPSVAYGWLYCKELERLKGEALLSANMDYNHMIKLTPEARLELKWWIANISSAKNKIRSMSFDLEIFSDASHSGWGATCNNKKAHGFWDHEERNHHINFLELKAAFLALKCFANNLREKQILLRIDNVTALAHINKMGGTKYKSLHEMSKRIWEWCMARELWIFAEYVASKSNPADYGSRIDNFDTEWELADDAFLKIKQKLGIPSIDLFASRINKKCSRYLAWERDPGALCVNAFTVSWKNEFFYAFPPFSLIARVLRKIREEGCTGILVIPRWPYQPWYPEFKRLLFSEEVVFSPNANLLLSPCKKIPHPLASSLSLVAGIVSGSPF